mmetsp:Transcript_28518/g.28893  ORF Transcript_28518/g.28893 Transcript_28518/m.28893 type:complete len:80 (+) Transcript_28518:718-957(+)
MKRERKGTILEKRSERNIRERKTETDRERDSREQEYIETQIHYLLFGNLILARSICWFIMSYSTRDIYIDILLQSLSLV